MAALFASGRIVDLILLGVLAEALVMLAVRRRLGAGLIANLAAGAALMLALRAALVGAGWPLVAAFLLAGLAAHLADLRLRLRADASSQTGSGAGRNLATRDAFSARRDLKRL